MPSIIAGDGSVLKEILNPLKENLTIHYSLAWARIEPGEKTLAHKLSSSEVYYILNGAGIVHIDNNEKKVCKNDTIYIPADSIQFIENTGAQSLEFLCIVDPPWCPEIESIITARPIH